MRKSNLVQAVAFGTLLSLSSACSYNQPSSYSYNKENQPTQEQLQREEIQKPKEKSGFRKFSEGTLYLTLQGLATAQYFIL